MHLLHKNRWHWQHSAPPKRGYRWSRRRGTVPAVAVTPTQTVYSVAAVAGDRAVKLW